MAARVLDVELTQPLHEVSGLDAYDEALIVLRFRGRPVGQTRRPISGGRLDLPGAHAELVEAAGPCLVERWVHEFLGWSDDPAPRAEPATVAVCTRDRPDDVRRCLEGLVQQPDRGDELLVVDNAPSTEATADVVAAFPRVRYVREPRPGLNRARNRALREARHDVVAFNDDDAVPDPGWLDALVRNFDDPAVACVTGLTMPLELETEAQELFQRLSPFGRGFRRVVFDATTVSPLAVGPIGAGANMAVRVSALDEVGPFDEALDAGTPTRSGGDSEMFSRLLGAGLRIVYDPAALNWHRHRRTRQELRQTLYGYGVGISAFLTRSLLVRGEWTAPVVAWKWFRHRHAPDLVRALLGRPGPRPLDLVVAELGGCLAGPWAYLRSRGAR